MEQVDDDLYEADEHNLFDGFEDMSDINFKKSEKANKSNHMMDASNLYLDLSNKLISHRDDSCPADSKYNKNKSFHYPYTTDKTGHITNAITNTASNKKKGTEKHLKTDQDLTGNGDLEAGNSLFLTKLDLNFAYFRPRDYQEAKPLFRF